MHENVGKTFLGCPYGSSGTKTCLDVILQQDILIEQNFDVTKFLFQKIRDLGHNLHHEETNWQYHNFEDNLHGIQHIRNRIKTSYCNWHKFGYSSAENKLCYF